MTKLKLLLLTVLIALTLGSVAMFLQGGRVGFDPARLADVLPRNVDMQLTGVNFSEVSEGKREWTMDAETLHYFKDKNLIVLDRVDATFFTKDGPMHLTGDKAYYHKDAQTVRVIGDVLATDSKGNRLVTEEMRYNVKTGVLLAPDNFVLTGPTLDLQGRGLSVDTRTSRIRVLSRPNLLLKSSPNIM